jgi:threonine aldolase
MIDLRSDTVTKPTALMREASSQAIVGDDVFGEDPSVIDLQNKMAELTGKEAALFVPSGTMSNQLAIGAQTNPGDELICEGRYHVFMWEAGGPARLWGVSSRIVQTEDYVLTKEHLENLINPIDPHYTQTKLVCLENTLNRGGGKIYPYAEMEKISSWSKEHGLSVHLDGARLWNASIASGIKMSDWTSLADTVSLCFSKGMGAPVGSVLVGPKTVIEKAYKLRKLLGGGMRQAGILAGACSYALDNHFERLADDHKNAKLLAEGFLSMPGVSLEFGNVDTNIIWLEVEGGNARAKVITDWFAEQGVLFLHIEDKIRLVTHLDVSLGDVEKVCSLIKNCPA